MCALPQWIVERCDERAGARGEASARGLPGVPRQGLDRPVAARRAAQGIPGAV
jgi:hypothetical protein